MVVVGKADEEAHVGTRRLRGPLCDGGDLAGVDSDTVLNDDMA